MFISQPSLLLVEDFDLDIHMAVDRARLSEWPDFLLPIMENPSTGNLPTAMTTTRIGGIIDRPAWPVKVESTALVGIASSRKLARCPDAVMWELD